jgi:hypothetical protein
VEALYPLLATDSDGNKPDCSKSRCALIFPDRKLPPVNAFWWVTMYDAQTQPLIENPINRYLINSPRKEKEHDCCRVLRKSLSSMPLDTTCKHGRAIHNQVLQVCSFPAACVLDLPAQNDLPQAPI